MPFFLSRAGSQWCPSWSGVRTGQAGTGGSTLSCHAVSPCHQPDGPDCACEGRRAGDQESILAKGLVEATACLGSPCAIVSLLCRKVQTIFEINSIYCSYLRNLKITNVHMFSKESLKFAYCQCICLGSCCAKPS